VAAVRKIISILMVMLMIAAPAMAEDTLPQVNNELLWLASSQEPLVDSYEPGDLVKLNSRRSAEGGTDAVYTASTTSIQLRAEAAAALVSMCNAAEADKTVLYVRQGYRSYHDEEVRYTRMEKRGEAAQKPGECDYQTGLAVTVVGKDWRTKTLTDEFAQTKEGKWLADNAAAYGFVLRYPENKQDITGWAAEPWHLRYVGVEAAAYMQRNGLCLEELRALVNPVEAAGVAVAPAVVEGVETIKITPTPEPAPTPTPGPTPEPVEGQMVVLDEVGPDGDHEIGFYHET